MKPHTDAGAFRAIATTGTERHPLFPDLPTLQEAGLPVTVVVWYGILAPAEHAGAGARAVAQGSRRLD